MSSDNYFCQHKTKKLTKIGLFFDKRFISLVIQVKQLFQPLPKGVFAISFFGLFLGASTTMVYNQLPMFMKHVLHASALKIAFIDGMVEFLSYFMRVFSGAISDYLKNRKFILLIGSIIIVFVKPMFGFAKSAVMVMFAQSFDRIGNGFQASPRDALIADLSTKHSRGRSFGFSKSLKTAGSLLGSLIAIALMYFTNDNYRMVFFCSAIPVMIAIVCLCKLKSSHHDKTDEMVVKDFRYLRNPFQKKYLQSMDMDFWKLIILATIFELGHFSEHLLALRANDFIGKGYAGSVGIFVALGQILCSYPIGLYADKLGKKIFIQLCMVLMIIASVSMMFATSIFSVFLGAFLWGGQMTATQGLFLSAISDKVDHHLVGTAIGTYYIAIGIAFFLASMIAGNLWTNFGSSLAFVYTIGCSLFSLGVTSFLYPKK